MRILSIIAFSLILCFTACKSDPSVAKVEYPAAWTEREVPKFPNGVIAGDKVVKDDLKTDYILQIQSDAPFEEIYNWHISEFADKGWKKIKNVRKNIGQDDEIIILVHTKGKAKHSITVLKGNSMKQEIKTTLSHF